MTSRRATASLPRVACVAFVALLLAACAEHQQKPASSVATPQTATRPAHKPWKPLGPYTPGGLYAPGVADGAPGIAPDVANLPEPVPHTEPLSHYGNRSPYVVLGKTYTVLPSAAGYDERGVASWYGTKFDGRVTSSFEPYDLTQFTAAHRTLPLPSYARVTNLDNGRSVIVRINDRGPFHEGRLIDLSYAAAIRLGVNVHGTANVEVRGIDTGKPLPPAPDATSTTAHAATATRTIAAPGTNVPSNPIPPTQSDLAAKPDATYALAVTPKIAGVAPNSSVVATPSTTSDLKPVASVASPAVTVEPLPAAPSANIAPSVVPAVDIPPAATTGAILPSAQSQTSRPQIEPSTRGFLQVASYGDRANAERMLQRLQQAGVEHAELVSVQVNGQTLWRVHVGPFSADEAAHVAEHMDALGFGNPPFFKD